MEAFSAMKNIHFIGIGGISMSGIAQILSARGYRVTGSNGNSIFLPAAGCYYGDSISYAGSFGYYWSSSHGDGLPFGSYDLGFDSAYLGTNSYDRYYGHSVRPVCQPRN